MLIAGIRMNAPIRDNAAIKGASLKETITNLLEENR
jgi:hypothetical protein